MDLACEMALKKDERLTPRTWLVKKAHNVDWMLEDVEFYDGLADNLIRVYIFSVSKKLVIKKSSLKKYF